MKQLTVMGAICSPAATRDAMVAFHHVVHGREEQSTGGIPSLLPLEQSSPARRQFGMAAQSTGPVQEIAIVEARVAPDLHVPLDRRLAVSAETCFPFAAKDPMAVSNDN